MHYSHEQGLVSVLGLCLVNLVVLLLRFGLLPVHCAPSSLVELRLACFSAVPSHHEEWLLGAGILAGPSCYPTTGFPLFSMALSIQLSYVTSIILGWFEIAPLLLEMGPNTSLACHLRVLYTVYKYQYILVRSPWIISLEAPLINFFSDLHLKKTLKQSTAELTHKS